MSVKCAVYVAVTVTPYHCSEGPTRSTVYPASWAVHSLREDFDRVGGMERFIEQCAVSFVKACSAANLFEWKKVGSVEGKEAGASQIGGVTYDALFSAVCKNPFSIKDTWYVNAWLKKLQSENVEEELHRLPCTVF